MVKSSCYERSHAEQRGKARNKKKNYNRCINVRHVCNRTDNRLLYGIKIKKKKKKIDFFLQYFTIDNTLSIILRYNITTTIPRNITYC